ncbi:MAG TPA: response regulator [Dyadobacter sp.]|uniref:response regulator n=1 Tax=Dyadobacter tibetensis TaxID=1211851 RepID=UPI000471EFFB|nr:response regulator [Dyadobacter tibetensis]HEV7378744.1 response regulator [Dyadobacter sp.]
MKLLLIEDDQHKSKQILDFISSNFPAIFIDLRRSYQSGLKEIIQGAYDLILLDMQLPNFDIKSGEDGYKFRKLAGMDILTELVRKKKNCKVVVITQFETFGEGENYIDLKSLKIILKRQFSDVYLDTIYYGADQSNWQKELKNVVIGNLV